MAYLVTADQQPSIDFAPQTVVAEVLQNVKTIISTIKYEVPLDRDFGIDGDIVDMPMPQAKARLTQEIFQAIKQYEPRASINSITFNGELSGRLIPTVEVSINDETD